MENPQLCCLKSQPAIKTLCRRVRQVDLKLASEGSPLPAEVKGRFDERPSDAPALNIREYGDILDLADNPSFCRGDQKLDGNHPQYLS